MTAVAPRRRSGKPNVLRKVVAYSASRGMTEVLLAVRGLALAAILGPAMFGVWALLRLGMRYISLVGASVFRGLELELLAGVGTGAGGGDGANAGARSAARPGRVTLGFVLASTGLLAALAFGASFLVDDPRHVLLLRGFAAAALAEQLYNYVLVCARIRHDLRRYALIETAQAALQLVCVLALAWAGGIVGAIVGMTVANLAGVVIGAQGVERRPSFHWPTLRRLLGKGLPIALNLILSSALATADRWIVAAFGGVMMLGYYAFAAQVASVSVTFAWVIRTVIFPDVYRRARSERPGAALRAHLEGAVMPFARLFPPLLGAASILIGPVLAVVLPRYVEAVGPARIFLLAGAAGGIVNLASIGAVVAGRQRALPAISGAALAVNLALSFLAISSGAGLEFVAAASFVGQVIFAVGVLTLVRRESGAEDIVPFLFRTLGPLAWCVAVVAALGRFLPSADIKAAALALVLYLVLLAPVVPAMRADWRRVRG